MHTRISNDILEAVGMQNARYTTSSDRSVVRIPMPSTVDARVLNSVLDRTKENVQYFEFDVDKAVAKLRISASVNNAKEYTDSFEQPKLNMQGIDGVDKEEIKRIASIISAASLDGIEPIFEIGLGVTKSQLFACRPATRYDHLMLSRFLKDFEWGYCTDTQEISVVVDMHVPTAKRRKT